MQPIMNFGMYIKRAMMLRFLLKEKDLTKISIKRALL
jgi:hypothetical protein